MKYIIGLLLCFITLLVQAHPHHVSITTLRYNAESQLFEVTIKTFTEDLEKALFPFSGDDTPIDDEKLQSEINKNIDAYVKHSIQLMVNDKPVTFNLLGKEVEIHDCYLYYQIPLTEVPKTVKVTSSYLTEAFEDQSNAFHFECGGETKSTFTKAGATEGSVDLSCN